MQERRRRCNSRQGPPQLHRFAREGPGGEAELSEMGGGRTVDIIPVSTSHENMCLFSSGCIQGASELQLAQTNTVFFNLQG